MVNTGLAQLPSPKVELDGVLYQNYLVEYVKIIDGDTFECDTHLGNGIWIKNMRVRMLGINAPETRTRDLEEKERGMESKRVAKEILENSKEVWLWVPVGPELSSDAFSRILAYVWCDGLWLNQFLLKSNLATEF